MTRFLAVGLLVLLLAGCESSEHKAQRHFDSAVALVAAGDADRAIVELRNVFKLAPQHQEARRLLAGLLRERGDIPGAYGQYARLVEQYPDDAEALKVLADMAFNTGDGGETRIRVDAALARLPDDSLLQAIDAATDYVEAQRNDNAADAADAIRRAQALLDAEPGLLPARLALVQDLFRAQRIEAALEMLDAGLALDKGARQFHLMRLGALQALKDDAGFEAGLKQMIALFPDEEQMLGGTLLRWYISRDRLDDAEAWLRSLIPADSEDPGPRMFVVQFLTQLRGSKAALAELDTVLASDPLPRDVAGNRAQFAMLRAGLMFDIGRRDEALAEMEALVAAAEPSDDTNIMKVTLARMRSELGNEVGARALVEEVLAVDPTQAEALKQKGAWLIDDDRTDEAIGILREALNAAARDSEAMLLLARAYERQGNRPLMGQMLAQAVEAANGAPGESMRYASFLYADQKYLPAESVLIDALRLDPGNINLLGLLTQVHMALKDWPRAEADLAQLRRQTAPGSGRLADELQARMLAQRGDNDGLTAFLESLAGSDGAGLGPELALIRAQVTTGNMDQALERARALVAAHPGEPSAEHVLATLLALTGASAEAEAMLRGVVAKAPEIAGAWTALYGVLLRRGDFTGARAVLDAAMAQSPDSLTLKWLKAGLLEQQGDIDGAIAVYEEAYAQNSDIPLIANNLASLLSSSRDDAASLERAWVVARRLKGTEIPAYADTYGWIAFLRGDPEEALPYLEKAALGVPNDPIVHYHLGKVYAALSRPDAARAALETALARLVDGRHTLPGLKEQIEAAIQGLDRG